MAVPGLGSLGMCGQPIPFIVSESEGSPGFAATLALSGCREMSLACSPQAGPGLGAAWEFPVWVERPCRPAGMALHTGLSPPHAHSGFLKEVYWSALGFSKGEAGAPHHSRKAAPSEGQPHTHAPLPHTATVPYHRPPSYTQNPGRLLLWEPSRWLDSLRPFSSQPSLCPSRDPSVPSPGSPGLSCPQGPSEHSGSCVYICMPMFNSRLLTEVWCTSTAAARVRVSSVVLARAEVCDSYCLVPGVVITEWPYH